MNAKKEFLGHVEGKPPIQCVLIKFEDWDDELYHDDEDDGYLLGGGSKAPVTITLPENYSEAEFDTFLSQLDFDYDAGYGIQMLFGTVWYKDGTYSERSEYDGSEWWEYRKAPEIPDVLINSDV